MNGAGITISQCSTVVSDNFIMDNIIGDSGSSCGRGAGIYCENASVQILNNRILGNGPVFEEPTFWSDGGGIACCDCNALIKGNIINHYCPAFRLRVI
jgi:hypothetical protein